MTRRRFRKMMVTVGLNMSVDVLMVMKPFV